MRRQKQVQPCGRCATIDSVQDLFDRERQKIQEEHAALEAVREQVIADAAHRALLALNNFGPEKGYAAAVLTLEHAFGLRDHQWEPS